MTSQSISTSVFLPALADDFSHLACQYSELCWLPSAKHMPPLLPALKPGSGVIRLDISAVTKLDSLAALELVKAADALRRLGYQPSWVGGAANIMPLLERVEKLAAAMPPLPPRPSWRDEIADFGERVMVRLRDAAQLVSFLGQLVVELLWLVLRPRQWPMLSLVAQIQEVGIRAVPIVTLLTFGVGVVLAYQGAEQLRWYGAELFVVNLLAISMLREIGALMTAIIIAGRSGSAFTAQIGAMKLNLELDAMQVMGLSPLRQLVVPRVVALIIVLPLLSFWAALVGLAGGAMVCWLGLGITPEQFITQLREAVTVKELWIGLFKAPFFAAAIAVIGCYQGMQVKDSAASVGAMTTEAVVRSIALVIALNAIFSVVFQLMGL